MDTGKLRSSFWLPQAVSLALTPVFLLLGLMSAGAGHGDYFLAKLLFPWTMFSTIFFHSIIPPFVVLAVIQYPTYGAILGFANKGRLLGRASAILLSTHALLAVVCVVTLNQNF